MPQARERRVRVSHPADWERVASEGAGPFEASRTVYRLPDGSEYVWESRRHRKGRGPVKATGRAALTADSAPESGSENPWLEFYAPHRISWWVALDFIVGSALFTLGALASLSPELFAAEGSLVADLSYFIGAVLFTIGIYLQVVEGLNAGDYIGLSRPYNPRSFTWFAWRPRRLEFVAPFILLVGSLFFNAETSLAAAETFGWVSLPLLVGLTSLGGAVGFVVSTYLQLVEVGHSYLGFRPREISWWVAALNLTGSVGFLVGSASGLGVPGLSSPAESLITQVSFLLGSMLFLAGSYLMLPEMFSE